MYELAERVSLDQCVIAPATSVSDEPGGDSFLDNSRRVDWKGFGDGSDFFSDLLLVVPAG
jgi:hypothetical protein